MAKCIIHTDWEWVGTYKVLSVELTFGLMRCGKCEEILRMGYSGLPNYTVVHDSSVTYNYFPDTE